jgi:diguanylate cyclase (GGDEF)-like protein
MKRILQIEPSLALDVVRRWLVLIIPTIALVVAAAFYFISSGIAAEQAEVWDGQTRNVQGHAQAITNDLENIPPDVLALAHSQALQNVLNNANVATAKDTLTEDWAAFLRAKGIYDKVRYVDEHGLEVVRVNYAHGNPQSVVSDQLQWLGNSYYFSDAMKLAPDQIYVSPLDLNVENSQIQVPYKPTLRVATPVQDAQGKKRGILILNYLASNTLDTLNTLTKNPTSPLMLLNSDGYWFKSPNPDDEWGFMFPEHGEDTFAHAYPSAWQRIGSGEAGQFQDDSGVYAFSTIAPLAQGASPSDPNPKTPPYTWKLVTRMAPDVFAARTQSQTTTIIVLTALFCLLLVGLTLLLARALALRARSEAALVYLSTHDSLTGVRNRAYFEHRLAEYEEARQSGFSIVVVDIDGLKTLNDSRGHAAGDILIRAAASVLQKSFRKQDMIARIGGDVFVVLLRNSAVEETREAVKQIQVESANYNRANGHSELCMSVGWATALPNEKFTETLTRADAAMYGEKRMHKQARGADESRYMQTLTA